MKGHHWCRQNAAVVLSVAARPHPHLVEFLLGLSGGHSSPPPPRLLVLPPPNPRRIESAGAHAAFMSCGVKYTVVVRTRTGVRPKPASPKTKSLSDRGCKTLLVSRMDSIHERRFNAVSSSHERGNPTTKYRMRRVSVIERRSRDDIAFLFDNSSLCWPKRVSSGVWQLSTAPPLRKAMKK